MFIDPNAIVPITVGEDTVWVKERMDFATRQRWLDAIMTIPLNLDATPRRRKPGKVRRKDKDQEDDAPQPQLGGLSRLQLGAANTALLELNIVRWEGPSFSTPDGKPVPCIPEMIRRLDPSEPLVDAVLARLNELNAPRDTLPGEDEGDLQEDVIEGVASPLGHD